MSPSGWVGWGRGSVAEWLPSELQLFALVLFAAVVLSVAPSGRAGQPAAGRLSAPAELVAQRTASSETFELPDGSFKTTLYPHPINYRTPAGQWRRIGSTFVAAERPGYVWESGANAFKAEFKSDSTDPGAARVVVDELAGDRRR